MDARPTRRTRRSPRLTPRGWALAAVAVTLICLAPLAALPALASIGTLLAGLVLAALIYILLAPSALRVTRSIVPDIVECGQRAVVRVDVVNESRWPSSELIWTDKLPDRGLAADPIHAQRDSALRSRGIGTGAYGSIGPLSGGAAHRGEYAVVGRLRGDYVLGPLRVRTGDPFGLVRRDHMFGGIGSLIVLPQRVALEPSVSGAGAVGTSRPASTHGGPGGDDVIARPYVPGDPLRRVHWKATAHRGEPMVRQEEQDDSRHALVLLDPSLNRSAGRATSGRGVNAIFEWAVSMAASLVEHLAEQGFTVTMQVLGTAIRTTVGHTHGEVRGALIDLAQLDPAQLDSVQLDTAQLDTAQLDTARLDPVEGDRPQRAAGQRDSAHGTLPRDAALTVAVFGGMRPWARPDWIFTVDGPRFAFIAQGANSSHMHALEDAGWQCLTYRDTSDLAGSWADLIAVRQHG